MSPGLISSPLTGADPLRTLHMAEFKAAVCEQKLPSVITIEEQMPHGFKGFFILSTKQICDLSLNSPCLQFFTCK